MARARSRARARALQVLYAWESRECSVPLARLLEDFVADRGVAQASQAYLFRLLRLIEEKLPEVDAALEAALTNWRLDRLSVIDRNVLRIGATELLAMPDVPPRTSIQEAIQLAERYGSAESPRFVNGVLDAVMKQAHAARAGVRS